MKIGRKYYWASAELSLKQGRFAKNVLAIFFSMAAILVFSPRTVFAEDYTVTNYSDFGPGSLREAINQSNSIQGSNTISVPAGTYTLVSGPLEINSNVIIIGAGGVSEGDAAQTIIQASDSADNAITRVFDINPLKNATGNNVALKALTIRNGNVVGSPPYGGAGIAADTGRSTVTVYNCIVENNKSSVEGAGLHISGPAGGAFQMEKTIVRNNSSSGTGGGIFLEGDLNAAISLSTIQNNASLTSQGGGMSIRPDIAAGMITITGSTITGNSATGTGQGGGIYLNSPATISNTTISGNVSDLDGGGVYYDNYGAGFLTFNNTIIENNTTLQLGKTKDLYIHTGGYMNAAPIITSLGTISVTEDLASPLTGISFRDIDSGSGAVTATFSVANGALSASSEGGVTVSGSGTGALTLAGTVSDINAFIAAGKISFTTAANSTESVTLTISINDGGNTGSGGALTSSKTVTLTVTPANDTPTAKSVVPNQSITGTGTTSFTASDIAEDIDGDTLTITGIVTGSDPGKANAVLSGGTVTVTGAAAGSTSVVVSVSDGIASVNVTVPITVAPPTAYALTITAGTGGAITTGSSGNYSEGSIVSISAVAASDYRFYRWTAVGGGTFADASSPSTSFTMPAANVTVKAEFEALPSTPTSPVITGISPLSGPESGGTTVTLSGTGFTGATAVNFGAVVGTNLTVINDTSITVTAPAGTGTVDVTVTTPSGTSAVNPSDRFTYNGPALISITTPSAITGVANGTAKTALALGLPTSVVLVTDQGNVNGNVSWDANASSYEVTRTTEQTFSVTGTVSLPAGVVNIPTV